MLMYLYVQTDTQIIFLILSMLAHELRRLVLLVSAVLSCQDAASAALREVRFACEYHYYTHLLPYIKKLNTFVMRLMLLGHLVKKVPEFSALLRITFDTFL